MKKELEEKKQKLQEEFEGNKAEAQFFIKSRVDLQNKLKIVETKLETLIDKGTMTAAKIALIGEMLKE